jgi:hypothetical protein
MELALASETLGICPGRLRINWSPEVPGQHLEAHFVYGLVKAKILRGGAETLCAKIFGPGIVI